jgi:hypothetical protein
MLSVNKKIASSLLLHDLWKKDCDQIMIPFVSGYIQVGYTYIGFIWIWYGLSNYSLSTPSLSTDRFIDSQFIDTTVLSTRRLINKFILSIWPFYRNHCFFHCLPITYRNTYAVGAIQT